MRCRATTTTVTASGVTSACRAPTERRSSTPPTSARCGSWRLTARAPATIKASSIPNGLSWLDGELAAAPDAPTLVAMHHPPFSTGMPAFDRIGMPDADRRALSAVLERHPQVRTIAAGHIHTISVGAIAGRPALTVPGTYAKAALRLDADHLEFVAKPPTFAVHVVSDGELTTHVESAESDPVKSGPTDDARA